MIRCAILHHDDWDGIVSAWVILRNVPYEASWTIRPVQYGSPVPGDITGFDTVFVLDFTYSRQALTALAQRNGSLVVIDHHKTAVESLASWAWPPNSTIVLETERYGESLAACELCWEYICKARGEHPGATPDPPLVQYAADRDTWAFRLPYSREVAAYAQVLDLSIEACDNLAKRLSGGPIEVANVAAMGGAVLSYQAKIATKAARDAVPLQLPLIVDGRLAGTAMGLAANMPIGTLISDVGDRLAKKTVDGKPVDFGCCWLRTVSEFAYSLRSGGQCDVSALAKGLGGGGHARAAGFRAKRAPWEWA